MSSWSRLRGPWPVLPVWGRLLLVAALSWGIIFWSPVGVFLRDIPVAQLRWLWGARELGLDRESLRHQTLGRDYRVIEFIRERTPEDAIIILPDPDQPSRLDRLKAKSVRWMSYFLYPRRLLHVYEQDLLFYRNAEWLLLDSPESAIWLPPEMRPDFSGGDVHVIPFDMGGYLDLLERGELADRYRPPRKPLRSRGGS